MTALNQTPETDEAGYGRDLAGSSSARSAAPLATTKISSLPRRDDYLRTLEAASVDQNRPFSEVLVGLAKEAQKAVGKKVRMRAKQPTKRLGISGAH